SIKPLNVIIMMLSCSGGYCPLRKRCWTNVHPARLHITEPIRAHWGINVLVHAYKFIFERLTDKITPKQPNSIPIILYFVNFSPQIKYAYNAVMKGSMLPSNAA